MAKKVTGEIKGYIFNNEGEINVFQGFKKYVASIVLNTNEIETLVVQAIVNINNKIVIVDIKDFLKENLNFKKFTKKRKKAIKNSIPLYEIEFKLNSDGSYSIDPKGAKTELLIQEIKIKIM